MIIHSQIGKTITRRDNSLRDSRIRCQLLSSTSCHPARSCCALLTVGTRPTDNQTRRQGLFLAFLVGLLLDASCLLHCRLLQLQA